ncbi:MAG: GGDEF domain-containing protein [Culicoidibacterales bacterium]
MLHISVVMFLVVVILFFEFRYTFDSDKSITLFGVLSFEICVFSIRNIVISIMALNAGMPLYVFLNSYDDFMLAKIIVFVTMIVYLIILERVMPIKIVTTILTNKTNTYFAIGILASISIYILLNKLAMDAPIDSNMMSIFNLKIGITGFLGFGFVLIYSNYFSRISLKKNELQFLQRKLKSKKKSLEELKEQQGVDFLTGVFTRNIAECRIEECLKSGKSFTVAFFDIDGLKFANDTYGHDEGDFYIKKVAEIIENVFETEIVSRFGGDEFLVVFEHANEYELNCKINIGYDTVKSIKMVYDKPFNTSVSYGVVSIKANAKYSLEEVIRIADERMYAFKEKHKKHRAY